MLSKQELIVENYFHGTSLEYFRNQIEVYGRYQHDNVWVCISPVEDLSRRFAIDRSRVLFTNKTPVVLRINGNSVRDRIKEDPVSGGPCVDFLTEKEFELVEVGGYLENEFKDA